MRVLRTDTTNFGQGLRDQARLTGAGVKVDFSETQAEFGYLGLWHLHRSGYAGGETGLEDASGNDRAMTNHGALPHEEGYRFDGDEDHYMEAAVPLEEASTATVECWIRDVAAAQNGYLFVWHSESGASRLEAYLTNGVSGEFAIHVDYYSEDNPQALLAWSGEDVRELFQSDQPFHLAIVFLGSQGIHVFVNGIKRREQPTELSPFSPDKIWLGLDLGCAYPLSAVLDEVRLSSEVLYSENFEPKRLLESGAYVSPVMDCLRAGSRWTDLITATTIPPETDISWEVRAADELDETGEPQASWQTYDGDPSSLPVGRYFQWQAALESSPDGFASPVVESVEAHVSDHGYDLYHGVGPTAECIDYSEPLARGGPNDSQISVGPIEPGCVHWFGVRPTDDRDIQSPVTQDEVRLELDASGTRVSDRPAGVVCAAAEPLLLGKVRLSWKYRSSSIYPQVFRIFGDGGGGTIDYNHALGEVIFCQGQSRYVWTSDVLASGLEIQLAVRAVAEDGTQDEQPAVIRVTPDSLPPSPVDALAAEVVL